MTIIDGGRYALHLRTAFGQGENYGRLGYPSKAGDFSGEVHDEYTRGYSQGAEKRSDAEITYEEHALAKERLKARREAEDDEA
jgi:hypothetical protein